MQGFDERNGMPNSIEKIWIAERDVLRASCHLLPNVRENHFPVHDAKNAIVYRHNRAMAAEMFAPAAGFRVSHCAVLRRKAEPDAHRSVAAAGPRDRESGIADAPAKIGVQRMNLREGGETVREMFGQIA